MKRIVSHKVGQSTIESATIRAGLDLPWQVWDVEYLLIRTSVRAILFPQQARIPSGSRWANLMKGHALGH
jgi:hypothetical protein